MQKVFAVVVTWNGQDQVTQCLESLQQSTQAMGIIVVDNASTDQTVDIVRRVCPGSTVLCLRQNLGFGRANNIGIKQAYEEGAEHVLLVNQDASIESGLVDELVELQQSNPEFGILSPLHLDGTGTQVDALFGEHFSKSSGVKHLLNDVFLNKKMATLYSVEFVNAAIWLLSRECIGRVGLFNPAFKHYGEDMEYADRVRYHGLRLGVAPGLHGFHGRIQSQPARGITTERYLMQEKAVIRYRLSRKHPGIVLNILSAFSRITFSTLPSGGSVLAGIRTKALLMAYLLPSIPVMMRMRGIAYRGVQSFFEDATSDSVCYSLPTH